MQPLNFSGIKPSNNQDSIEVKQRADLIEKISQIYRSNLEKLSMIDTSFECMCKLPSTPELKMITKCSKLG